MTNLKQLLNQSSHYLLGQILLMSAGFVSFPILTRILSVSDYGVLGIATTTISIIIAFVKLGVPSSIVRFYPEYKSKQMLPQLYSTIFFGYGAVACIVTVISCIALYFYGINLGINKKLVLLMAIIIIGTFCNVIVTSTMRAEQQTKTYNIIMVASRYSALLMSIFILVFFRKDLVGFYQGQAISILFLSSIILLIFYKKNKLSLSLYSNVTFKDTLRFGSYLSWSEIVHMMLSYADRYMIQFIIGSVALGIYTAGYNLATYVIELIMYPLFNAIDPIINRIYKEDGVLETQKFLTKTFSTFLIFVLPVCFGFAATGKDLIYLLASDKFAEAEKVMLYIVVGNAIYSCQGVLNAGLFLNKKTHVIMKVKLITCVINISLNYFLIPINGIVGAAQATLATYIIYIVLITWLSFKEISFNIEYNRICGFTIASVIMYFVIQFVSTPYLTLTLFLKVAIGVIIYLILLISIDSIARNYLLNFVTPLRKRNCEKY